MRALLCALLSLAAAPSIAADVAPCPALPDLELACVSSQHGWFYARDLEAAAAIANDAGEAFLAFERFFGVTPPRGAVLAVGSEQPIPPEIMHRLRESTGAWTMPWLSPEERKLLTRRSVEKQVRESQPQLPDERIEALVASALQRIDAGSLEQGALRHEIGHKLLIESFWPQRDRGQRASNAVHYGGPGPDWLDETAAVLAETAEMQARRRAFLDKDKAGAQLSPLQDYFSSDHPLTPKLGQLQSRGAGATIRVVTGDEASRLAGGAHWFYVQSLAVADFLMETATRPGVFASVAPALARGDSMATWLSEEAATFGLPASIDALDAAWWEWLRIKHGVSRVSAIGD